MISMGDSEGGGVGNGIPDVSGIQYPSAMSDVVAGMRMPIVSMARLIFSLGESGLWLSSCILQSSGVDRNAGCKNGREECDTQTHGYLFEERRETAMKGEDNR